jgi:hypothetical protein
VDPYFGGDDVRRIILAIPEPEISVRILTSHMHLRRLRIDPQDESAHHPAPAHSVRRIAGRCASAFRAGWSVVLRGLRAVLQEEWGNARPSDRIDQSEGAYLARCIAETAALPHSNPISIRVMPGRQPAIHDRFLCEPDRLWMLGSSINSFGKRGTLMIVVPDPEPVLEDLERVWDDSAPLEEWLAQGSCAGTAP